MFILPKLLPLRGQTVFINFYENHQVLDFNYESRSEVLCANLFKHIMYQLHITQSVSSNDRIFWSFLSTIMTVTLKCVEL